MPKKMKVDHPSYRMYTHGKDDVHVVSIPTSVNNSCCIARVAINSNNDDARWYDLKWRPREHPDLGRFGIFEIWHGNSVVGSVTTQNLSRRPNKDVLNDVVAYLKVTTESDNCKTPPTALEWLELQALFTFGDTIDERLTESAYGFNERRKYRLSRLEMTLSEMFVLDTCPLVNAPNEALYDWLIENELEHVAHRLRLFYMS